MFSERVFWNQNNYNKKKNPSAAISYGFVFSLPISWNSGSWSQADLWKLNLNKQKIV